MANWHGRPRKIEKYGRQFDQTVSKSPFSWVNKDKKGNTEINVPECTMKNDAAETQQEFLYKQKRSTIIEFAI